MTFFVHLKQRVFDIKHLIIKTLHIFIDNTLSLLKKYDKAISKYLDILKRLLNSFFVCNDKRLMINNI